ncbi:cellulose-binding domain-containing protein [Streptomyces sp. NPDC052610]|uniref:cellulose-binding domain-containing protein n=1 Tax=Streptomyces sp. NPDC052610 TaxID=3154952 RepID=UPI00341D6637
MPDLPTPRDATEEALFTECWDTVLSYADLCTSGSAAAGRLAREAFARGMREVRGAESAVPRGPGRRPARLPRIPLLLTAVRDTAADWEAAGEGHHLDPDLRLWLNSDKAARHTGPPQRRPLALRGLRDMQEPDAALLWLTEVEALPLPVAARRLGLDPAGAAAELAEVRALFRDRCLRSHRDAPLDPTCRGYARLLDAVTRNPATESPEDLTRHLAHCVHCSEAAACLRTHGGGLPAALAGGVIGWGGLAYLERRRRAAEARLGPGRPDDFERDPEETGAHKARVLRNGLLVAAVLVSVLALAVTLVPFDGTGDHAAAPADSADRQPVADPHPSRPDPEPSRRLTTPSAGSGSAGPTRRSGPRSTDATDAPEGTRGTRGTEGADAADRPHRPDPDPEPQGTAASTAPAPPPGETASPSCHVRYSLAGQWPDGFQATVTVHTDRAHDDWRVGWTFPDGQRVNQMWDATHTQDGSRVTARAAHYNRTVPADGTLTFGFLASWQGRNAPAYDFTLNGRPCGTS